LIEDLKNIIMSLNEGESIMLNLKRTSPLLKKIVSAFFSSTEKRSIIASLKNISNADVEIWIKRTRLGISIIIYAPSKTFSKNIKLEDI